MTVRETFKNADRSFRLYVAREISELEYETDINCLTITGNFVWKSKDHMRIYEWFRGPRWLDEDEGWD